MIVVTSGFVFGICQTIENPDFRLWSPSSRCPGKPPSENKGVTQGAGIRLSPGLLVRTGQAPGSPIHCLRCLPCSPDMGAILIPSGSDSSS